jgi:hypothetical protein
MYDTDRLFNRQDYERALLLKIGTDAYELDGCPSSSSIIIMEHRFNPKQRLRLSIEKIDVSAGLRLHMYRDLLFLNKRLDTRRVPPLYLIGWPVRSCCDAFARCAMTS